MKSPIWFSIIFLAASIAWVAAATKPQTKATELTATERWLIEQVNAGKEADLGGKFSEGEKEKRKVSARFLEDLLTGALPGVTLDRHGVRIGGAILTEAVDLSNARIPCTASLEHCQFKQSVSFSRAVFAGAASFSGSTFQADADFSTVKTANDLFFERTIFQGSVIFVAANIGNALVCNGAQFKDKGQGANFNNMIARAVIVKQAVFSGPVNFGSANVGTHFEADGAQFTNSATEANFNDLHCGALMLNNAIFEGPVNFNSAEIVTNFEADECQFRGQPKSAALSVRCGALGLFEKVAFAGRASFVGSNFLDLLIDNTQPNAGEIPELDLSGSSITRRLYVQNARVKKFNAKSLHVGGSTKFSDLAIGDSANLSYSDFFSLDLSGSTWPRNPSSFDIQGMNYKYIRAAADESASHKALLKLVDQAAYAPDVYSSLESFLSRVGYQEDADQAFIAGKRRERREHLHGANWVGSVVVDALAGFGRRRSNAIIPCALCVFLGSILFAPRKMEAQETEGAPRVYNRFWYSLGLFFPFVDLQVNKAWQPKPDQTLLRNYVPVHILLGWILVPIGFAVVAGAIK